MKTERLWMLVLAVCLSGGAAHAQEESSTDVYNQIASMEYKQWSFSPKWYYYNRYWGTVVDMPWPIPDIKGWLPGVGFHDSQGLVVPTLPYVPFYNFIGDNYVNEQWRQMYPLRLTAASEAVLQAGNTEDEKQFWKEINIKDLVVYADRSTDLPLVGAKAVTADDRDEFSQRILDDIHNIRELGGDECEEIADDIRMQYDVIHEEIGIVGNAHEANANRLRTLQDCNNRLRKLAKKSSAIYGVLKLKNEQWVKNLSAYNKKWRRKKDNNSFP